MGAGLIGRIASMDRREALWRASTAARTAAQAAAWRARKPAWQRADVVMVLAEGGLRQTVAEAAVRADWKAVDRALADHFVKRPRCFVVHPSDRARLSDTIGRDYPRAREEARGRAASILDGRYDLLGHRGLTFGAPPDWHLDPVRERRAPRLFWSRVPFLDPAIGDHKVIWELNRHQHWLTLGRAWWLTGDPRFRRRALDELHSWLASNPPLTGVNWASMLELGLRSISWIWALHLFAESDRQDARPWLADLLVALDAQLEHVRRNLSHYFSPNTHLLGEALALYVAGRALPELAHAKRWTAIGRDNLLREIERQILPDGGHVERSTHYHRYALDYYLLAAAMARVTRDEGASDAFDVAVGRLAAFARAICDDRGRVPALGDDDGGMLFPIAGRDPLDLTDSLDAAGRLLGRRSLSLHQTEESAWLLDGWAGVKPGPSDGAAVEGQALAHRFDDSGYYVGRPPGMHLIFDVGRHGFLNGGHAHADALSITLSLDGRPVLIDPGTAVYSVDGAQRDRFRGSRFHNTLLVDGRAQSEPAGPFQWRSRADARPLVWSVHPSLICFEGAHDGYAPLEHRRTVLCFEDLILVADHVVDVDASRETPVAIDAHWHLDPRWAQARCDPAGQVWLFQGDRDVAWLATTARASRLYRGDDASGLGWASPRYGHVMPTATVVASTGGRLPIAMVTALGAGAPWRLQAVAPSALIDDGWHRSGVVLERQRERIIVLFATEQARTPAHPDGEVPHPSASWPTRVVDTDARVAVVRIDPAGGVRAHAQVGGTRLRVAALSLAG